MIFYFSATGNSKWIATTIANAIGDNAVDLLTADPKAYRFSEDDFLGVVFPVYWYAAPDVVLDFAKQLEPNGAFTFAVCNFSNVAAHALQHFSAQALHLNSGYGLLMPDNYPISDVIFDTEESTLEKLKVAPAKLNAIIERIKAREDGVIDVLEGDDPEEATRTGPVKFREECITAPFSVTADVCISCGLCEELCPAKVIELSDGHPVWTKNKCFHCMACINRCPVEAIEYGEYSKGRYRYTFEKYYPRVNK